MKQLNGLHVREGFRLGTLSSATDSAVSIRWQDKSMIDSMVESVDFTDARLNQIELLTLTYGWTSMAEAVSGAIKGTTRSLVSDIRSILAEDIEPAETEVSVEEVTLSEEDEKTGKSLEKKAREKRKGRGKKSGEGGHNPFKTKSSLGPGPRSGSNSQTKKWKCSCSTPYKCLCKNRKTGGTKTIRIKRAYKKDYNHEYKAWRKHQEF